MAERVRPCTACHGDEGRATADGYFPRIAGKPADYLFNQLSNFRDGRRQHRGMRHLVAHLEDAYLRDMARHFAVLDPPFAAPPPVLAAPDAMERGRVLATRGDTAARLPACAACHGERLTGTLPAVPGLIGLPRDYLNAQIGAWRNGTRRAGAPDCMQAIAQRLDAADLGAVTAYLAAQVVPANHAPAATPARPPLECGSMPGNRP